jgi:hypothetical protein
MPRNKKETLLDIEIFHFSRKPGTFSPNPVEIYSYLTSNYVNKSQDYWILPRARAYLLPCNNENPYHRVGDNTCEFLKPEQSGKDEWVNAILIENASRKEKLPILVGVNMQLITACPYGISKQVEIPQLLLESRANL